MEKYLMFVIGIGLIGCTAETTGDGAAIASLSLALSGSEDVKDEPSAATIAAADPQGSIFAIDEARAVVRHIQLDLPDGQTCADLADFDFQEPVRCDEDKVEITGPFLFDLLTGESDPSLDAVVIPAGTYRRIDVRFDDADQDTRTVGANDPLAGHTMHALGSYSGNQESDFELLLHFNEDARFETPDGIDVGMDAASEIPLRLDVGLWFAELPVTQCLEDGELTIEEGVLRIDDDEAQCSDIENDLKTAIKTSGQIEAHDSHDDGDPASHS